MMPFDEIKPAPKSIYYVIGTDAVFDAGLPYTLKEEGGYSNDKFDPGGMTDDGITQREYDPWRRKWGLPTQWVGKITRTEYTTIYFQGYWLEANCPAIQPGLSLCVFDTAVNEGVHVGKVLLQRALGVADDGVFGEKTLQAVQSISPVQMGNTIQKFYSLRAAYYRETRNFKRFGADWLRRDLDIEKASIQLYNHFTTGQVTS